VLKTPLLIWVLSTFVVFFVYFKNYDFGAATDSISPFAFFTLNSLKFILLYLSNGLIPHLNLTAILTIQIIASVVIISLIIGGTIYLRFRQKETKAIVPWIQFGLIGLISSGIVALARQSIEFPLSHYVTIAAFSQISALIIATMIFVRIHNHSSAKRKKTVASIIFLILIVIIVISSISNRIRP